VTFDEVLEQALEMLRRRGRVSYRALQVQFQLDDTLLEILKDEIVEVHQLARDQEGKMLVWTGDTASSSVPASPPVPHQGSAPLTYTPPYLAGKILTSRPALEGERKQVTVLFADIKDSTELIKDLDPEAAQQLLDPALRAMMEAVHRFEGTVNQVLGDGIMALFGAPLAREDHALRACYAALTMQSAMREHTEAMRRAHGIELRIRVGLNSGEVVVRAIGNDLHMDYWAVGQTTHLAARMEQLATPGTIRLTAATLRLVEGLVRVHALGPIPVKGMTEPVEVVELVGASALRRRQRVPGLSSMPCGPRPMRQQARPRRGWASSPRHWRWWTIPASGTGKQKSTGSRAISCCGSPSRTRPRRKRASNRPSPWPAASRPNPGSCGRR
jgi:class 3 adenylate cyclase